MASVFGLISWEIIAFVKTEKIYQLYFLERNFKMRSYCAQKRYWSSDQKNCSSYSCFQVILNTYNKRNSDFIKKTFLLKCLTITCPKFGSAIKQIFFGEKFKIMMMCLRCGSCVSLCKWNVLSPGLITLRLALEMLLLQNTMC